MGVCDITAIWCNLLYSLVTNYIPVWLIIVIQRMKKKNIERTKSEGQRPELQRVSNNEVVARGVAPLQRKGGAGGKQRPLPNYNIKK